MVKVVRLDAAAAREKLNDLAAVLVDCVHGGASVSFMEPFSTNDAETFFRGVIEDVESGSRILLAALDNDGLIGTVQIVPAHAPNQPHRADIAKLLVHRRARNKGVGQLLMEAVEEHARAAGKTLLVLDTVTGAAGERLYSRLGWTRVGEIPNYALFPDGRPTGTTIFFKSI